MPFLAFHFDNSCINVGLGGACGFGEFGRTVNDGSVSGASARLYKDGSGCGACYQVYYYFSYYIVIQYNTKQYNTMQYSYAVKKKTCHIGNATSNVACNKSNL